MMMEYDAFISYSQEGDSAIAEEIRNGLTYLAKPWWQRRALRIFLDRSVLTANPSIWASISQALEESEWMILLASPEAARSKWVDREVSHWLDRTGSNRLIIALTAGNCEWNTDGSGFSDRSTAIPPALMRHLAEEPRHVDFSWARGASQIGLQDSLFRERITELAAPIRGLSKEDLEGKDIFEHRRTRRSIAVAACIFALLFVISAVAGTFALTQTRVARQNADDSDFQRIESQASDVLSSNPSLGLLLAVEGWKLRENSTSRSELLTVLQRERGYLGQVPTQSQPTDVALLDRATAAYTTSHGTLGFVSLRTSRPEGRLLRLGPNTHIPVTVRFAKDDSRGVGNPLIVARFDTGQIWRISPRLEAPIGPAIDVGSPIFAVASSQRLGLIAVGVAGGAVDILRDDGSIVRRIDAPVVKPDPYVIPVDVANSYYGAGNRTMRAADIEALAFSPAGSEIAIERVGGVEQFDLATTETTDVSTGVAPSTPPSIDESLAYGPSGNNLVISEPTSVTENPGQGLQELEMFNLVSDRVLWRDQTETGLTVFAQNGQSLLVVDSSGDVVSIPVNSGEELQTIFSLHEGVDGIATISGSASIVLASASSSNLTIISSSNASPIVRTCGHAGQSPDGFSPDGRELLVETGSNVPFQFSLWKAESCRPAIGAIPWAILGQLGPSDTMTAIFNDGTAGTIDLRTLKRVGPVIHLNLAGVVSDSSSPTGNLLMLGHFNGSVDIYRQEDGVPRVIRLNGPVDQLAASSEGMLAIQVLGEPASLYRLSDGRRIASVGRVSALTFSGDGVNLVVGTDTGQLKLLNVHNGLPTGPKFPSIPIGIAGTEWSHAYVGSMDNSGSIRLYDPVSGQQIGDAFVGIVDDTGAWSLNPAGTTLAAETPNGVDLWDLKPQDWLKAACKMAGRNPSEQEWQSYFSSVGTYQRVCPEWPSGANS